VAYTIALPIPSFLPALGGAEVGLHNIAQTLIDKGHRPIVITSYRHVKALNAQGWRLPYEVIPYPPRLLTLYQTKPLLGRLGCSIFYKYLQKKCNFDVWHATFGYPVGCSVAEFCLKNRLPHVIRCVGDDIQIRKDIGYGMRRDPQVDQAVRTILPNAQKLIATTQTVRDEYGKLGIDDSKIVMLPNGVDLKRFKEFQAKQNLKQKLDLSSGTFLFLALGRYHPKKNFEQLIDVARALKAETNQDFAIAIYGTGVSALADKIQSFDLAKTVFTIEPPQAEKQQDVKAPSDDVLNWYHGADCFVMPSLIETFGIVTVEAMAAALPVIAADSPGSRDVIRGGKDGKIYDGSVEQLVDTMKCFLDDPVLLEQYKEKSLSRAEAFDWSHIVDNYLELYQELKTGDA